MHNPTVFSGFIRGETLRHRRNNSDTQNLRDTISSFKLHLRERGYKDREINQYCEDGINTERTELLRFVPSLDKQIPLVFVTKFHFATKRINRVLKKHYKKLMRDERCKKLFPKPPMIAYSRHRNLKEILTRSLVRY